MKKLIGMMLMASMLLLPAMAHASTSWGESPYDTWESLPSSGSGALTPIATKMEFTSGADGGSATYVGTTNNSVYLNPGFGLLMKFHFDSSLTGDKGLSFGLVNKGAGGPVQTFYGSVFVDGSSSMFGTYADDYIYGQPDDPVTIVPAEGITPLEIGRSISDGYIGVQWVTDWEDDIFLGTNLGIGLFASDGVTLLGGSVYKDVDVTFDIQQMSFFMNGWSDSAVGPGQMFFGTESGGPIAPEPVSSALFLVGGGALAFLRRKKQ